MQGTVSTSKPGITRTALFGYIQVAYPRQLQQLHEIIFFFRCQNIFFRCATEASLDPRGHPLVTWGVYLWAGKPPLADIILSHPPDLRDVIV